MVSQESGRRQPCWEGLPAFRSSENTSQEDFGTGTDPITTGYAVNQAQSADVDQNHLSESATTRPVAAIQHQMHLPADNGKDQ